MLRTNILQKIKEEISPKTKLNFRKSKKKEQIKEPINTLPVGCLNCRCLDIEDWLNCNDKK